MNTQDNKEKQGAFQLDPPVEGVKGRGKRIVKPGMNKKITFLVLGVLFLVLVVIVISRLGKGPDKPSEDRAEAPAVTAPIVEAPSGGGEGAAPSTPEPESQAASEPLSAPTPDAVPEWQTVGPSAQSEFVAQQSPPQSAAPHAPEPALSQPDSTEEIGAPGSGQSAEPEISPQVAQPAPQAAKPTSQAVKAAPATPARKATPVASTVDKNQLRNIKFRFAPDGKGVRLEVSTSSSLEHFKFFNLDNPPRVVLDLLGSFKEHASTMNVPSNQLISGIRIGKHDEKLRIVADIKGKPPKSVDVERVSETELVVNIVP